MIVDQLVDRLPGLLDTLKPAVSPMRGLIVPCQQVYKEPLELTAQGIAMASRQVFDLRDQVVQVQGGPVLRLQGTRLLLCPGVKVGLI
jgi:hypothetical protein